MYAFFEEAGKFLAGRVMSEGESSLQIELDSGKRVKAKATQVLIRFTAPSPADMLAAAQAMAPEVDLDLVWESAPDDDFGFDEIAKEYFGAQANAVQQAATLWALFDAPHYFQRRGKGRFRKAPADVLKQALAAIERKRLQQLQIAEWATDLVAGRCPAAVAEQLYRILFKPDKNAPEYKAVVAAAQQSQRAPLDLLRTAGAISSPYQFHRQRFLFELFPKGTAFPALPVPAPKEDLPLASVQAFSIDDSATTEIDDALSVQGLGTGTVIYGIHIAAPGLALAPDMPWDKVARERLSTVYVPGWKLTMLPAGLVEAYTLIAGRACPAVSLYVTIDEATLAIQHSETRLERVHIASNLRHDQLDDQVTDATLRGEAPADYPHAAELAFAYRLAQSLKAQREVVRGKPEVFNRPDYNFRLERDGAAPATEPDGSEAVIITERRRGAPLDLIVSEAMILANSRWGAWLGELGVPGIYRSQASLSPGIKVRMGVKPAPHAGIGVAQYTWATSPLRRYVDLVNQWQIIACAKHGRTAALAAPFKPKDATLFSIISAFDTAYSAYNDYQNALERFWALRWIEQQNMAELDAAVMKDGLVRADTLPLVFRCGGTESLPRGTAVRVRVAGIDLLTLELHATLLARRDQAPSSAALAEAEAADEDADDEVTAAPLALAIDVSDTPAEGTAPAP